MARGAYIGVSDKARKIKKGYIGVDGKARKIKKGYIGVGGVARPFWSGGELAYFGEISPISTARSYIESTSVGEYALLAGGVIYNGYQYRPSNSGTVDAYNTDLVRFSCEEIEKRYAIGAASTENHAFFCGGASGYPGGSSNPCKSQVDIFTKELVHITSVSLVPPAGQYGGGFSDQKGGKIGNAVMFRGGLRDERSTGMDFWFTDDLVKTYSNTYGITGLQYAAATAGEYLLFPKSKRAYSPEKTYQTITGITAVSNFSGGSTKTNAFFAGGNNGGVINVVNAYTADLVKKTLSNLSQSRTDIATASAENFVVFAAGSPSYQQNSLYVDSFTEDMVKTQIENLQTARSFAVGQTIGQYMIFAGGVKYPGGNDIDTVEAYVIS